MPDRLRAINNKIQVTTPKTIDKADAIAIFADSVNSVYITIGITSIFVASVKAVPKAPIAVANAIAPDAISDGIKPGSITSITTLNGFAPRVLAASSSAGSSFSAVQC